MIDLPKFVKIDVEGQEFKVVSGISEIDISGHYIIMEFANKKAALLNYLKASKILLDLYLNSYKINASGHLEDIKLDDIVSYLNTQKLESDNIVFSNI